MGTGSEVYLMPARKGKSKLLTIDPLDLILVEERSRFFHHKRSVGVEHDELGVCNHRYWSDWHDH